MAATDIGKGEKQTITLRSPHTWLWKPERPNYMSSYNQCDLNPGILQITRLSSGRARGQEEMESPTLRRGHSKQTAVQIYYRSSRLKYA